MNCPRRWLSSGRTSSRASAIGTRALEWLVSELGVPAAGAAQIVDYLGEALRMLGALPTLDTLLIERFFDESGGMQLVLHAPFGSRVNRAWGLALRKRFCRQFNFELQAAATEDALLLSLGPQHSFPLEDVFRYLHPASVRDILHPGAAGCAGLPDALAVESHALAGRPAEPRRQEGAAAAAADAGGGPARGGVPGCSGMSREHRRDRELPDHPLVRQTIDDRCTKRWISAGCSRSSSASTRAR